MVFDGQLIDAGKFQKQLLALSQGDLCADCLITVLNELDNAPKIGILSQWDGTPFGCCSSCAHATESIRYEGQLNCPMWGAAGINQYGFCHMWKQKEN